MMAPLDWLAVWGVSAIAAGIGAGFAASAKNRDYSAWAAWSILFPPAVIILLLLPKRDAPHRRRTLAEREKDFHRS